MQRAETCGRAMNGYEVVGQCLRDVVDGAAITVGPCVMNKRPLM